MATVSTDVLESPILVIGAGRSGTQLLGRLLAAHPDVAYLEEPSYTWRYGNGHLPHEMFPATAARPQVVRHIRETFREMCIERGRTRIAEKTPANCLRLPFVLNVLPDARILHLVRDGRDVAVSVRKKLEGNPDKVTRRSVLEKPSHVTASSTSRLARLRWGLETTRRKLTIDPPGFAYLYYLPSLVEQQLALLGFLPRAIWGPRIPGFRQLLRTHTTLEVAAMQWRICVEQVLNYTASHPELPCCFVRFEDLCQAPRETAQRIFDFCKLDLPPNLDVTLDRILPVEPRSFERELRPEEIPLLHDLIGDTLQRLGYEL